MCLNSTLNIFAGQVFSIIFSVLMYNNKAMTNLLSVNENLSTKSISTGSCAEVLVKTLENLGVENIFGYPGAAVLSIYNELSHSGIKHFLVRHEQAAVHAAEGYARVSGKPGVVLVTSGPGFTNTITGIANAYADSTPLVILAGDVAPQKNKGKVFQKVDIISMTKTCSKRNYLLSCEDDVRQVLEEAFAVAQDEKGPVVIALPRNVLESGYTPSPNIFKTKVKLPEIQNSELERAARLLASAKQPLLLLGGGSLDSVDEIKDFVSKTNIPVISTLMGIGAYPSADSRYLGMIGINGTYPANTALYSSDFILALGVSFSDRSTCKNDDFAPNAKIVNVNLKKIPDDFDIEIIADSSEFLRKFIEYLPEKRSYADWYNKINLFKEENTNSLCRQSSGILKTIYEYTKDSEPVVVTDVGQHQMLTAQYFNFNKPKKFITSGGLGTMGFGLPAAIGAYLANPENLVLNITGDGSFQMNLQELATCREHNIPVKIIIMNNSYLGMVRQMQEKIYKNMYQVEMINPDFTKIAEAYDLFAVRVTSENELRPALEKAISYPGTAIIDIAINSFEEI